MACVQKGVHTINKKSISEVIVTQHDGKARKQSLVITTRNVESPEKKIDTWIEMHIWQINRSLTAGIMQGPADHGTPHILGIILV